MDVAAWNRVKRKKNVVVIKILIESKKKGEEEDKNIKEKIRKKSRKYS